MRRWNGWRDVLLLAIDTATRRVGVALGGEQGVLAEVGFTEASRTPRHAEQLVPAIALVCERAGVGLEALSGVAVGIGPGMFTGLRVGVTTAKVMAQALRVPVVAVPSLDLVAYPLRHSAQLVVPVLDARRAEVYYAIYRPVPGGVQRESGYELASPRELAAELAARGEEALLCGDGALRFRDVLAADRAQVAGPAHAVPSVTALLELAVARFEREEFSAPAEVRPLYLRRSDAELAFEGRG